MKHWLKKLLARPAWKQAGFTLAETLVILTAFAAITVPTVTRLVISNVEENSIQTAIDAMMVEEHLGVLAVPASGTDAFDDFSTFDFDPGAGEVFLTSYLTRNPTDNYYCWDASGNVTKFDYAGAASEACQ